MNVPCPHLVLPVIGKLIKFYTVWFTGITQWKYRYGTKRMSCLFPTNNPQIDIEIIYRLIPIVCVLFTHFFVVGLRYFIHFFFFPIFFELMFWKFYSSMLFTLHSAQVVYGISAFRLKQQSTGWIFCFSLFVCHLVSPHLM